ncbi:nuclear pore complex protein NUP88-like [Cucurbita moschata]|uniref:Nuclear pore complex protein NUP88-like n=1 Tax=Cucurbita moschata TaxID=3662 RepID=A0A6J1FTH0_CUCMO|nr:nuclear pore complex protein NUP88-like [Cucurbita moschata]
MRYNLDLNEADSEPRRSLTPKRDVDWVPLKTHPVFTAATAVDYGDSVSPPLRSLLVSDGASRLYFWDSTKLCLHRISIRLGEPEPTSVLAASPSKVLQPDVPLDFVVHKISINKNGSAIALVGPGGLWIMYLYGHSSTRDSSTVICRTVRVGPQIYYGDHDVIRTLQVSWHPYSNFHLGVLSSDSVFRLFNLSSDGVQPEQEYYLQPVEPGQSKNASSICPVDFSFGGDHLWDKFSVFVLFSDGSIYILCPVVPFRSTYKCESILEIYNDAQSFGLKSANPTAVSNSSLAISWLEETFPNLVQATSGGDMTVIVAHPCALFDASLALQGPLRRACNNGNEGDISIKGAECEGRAVSLLYKLISKDSVLVTAWSGGQLQIDALADEIQPVWNLGSPPRVHVDPNDNILGHAMICEPITGKLSEVKLDQPLDYTVWMGLPPPLLRLAIVDLALPKKMERCSLIMMFVDKLMDERIYALHNGGIDSIILHFLPFTSQSRGQDQTMKTPSVHPVLNTCQGDTSNPFPLCGFASLSDSFGYSWIVGVTISQECIVLEMKTWNLQVPVQFSNFLNEEKLAATATGEKNESERSEIISKNLLSGPKVVLLPQSSSNMRSVTADSIEGRSMLHQYFKLFHENYVEYAHTVYYELKQHGPELKRLIDDQQTRLREAQQKLLKVRGKQELLEDRIERAIKLHNVLEERIHRLKNLPGAHKRPLSKAEREFKSTLDHFTGVEVDALHTSIDTLTARLRRYTNSSKNNNLVNQQHKIHRRNTCVQGSQISQLKSSLEKLSLLNAENAKKVKLVESTIKSKEANRC